jgi:hypothetical protein
MENDYFLSHTFDQFDDFVNGRPIRPYEMNKLKRNPTYNNNNSINSFNANNRFRNNYDYDNMRTNMNLSQNSNEHTHYEPYFSKSTSRNHPKLYSPANSQKSLYASSQPDFNFPVINPPAVRSFSQQNYHVPIISNAVPKSVRYVPSNVLPQPIVQPSVLPITANQIHTTYQPIHQPQPTQLITAVPSRYAQKPVPIINTFSYQPVKLPSINKSKRLVQKIVTPIKFVTRSQAHY